MDSPGLLVWLSPAVAVTFLTVLGAYLRARARRNRPRQDAVDVPPPPGDSIGGRPR